MHFQLSPSPLGAASVNGRITRLDVSPCVTFLSSRQRGASFLSLADNNVRVASSAALQLDFLPFPSFALVNCENYNAIKIETKT